MSRAALLEAAVAYFDDGRFLADLTRRVTIPTESQVPERRPALYRYLEDEMAAALVPLGYDVTIHDNPDPGGGPFLIARRIEDPDLATVLTYGHADVVHGLPGRWREGLDPWRVTVEGDRIYGRGVVDNKGQHTISIAALGAVLSVRGRLGFNSIVFIETSEEIGSHGIGEFAQAKRALLAADLLIGADGPRVAIDRPTLYLGARGAINLELSVDLRAGGHHSGNWGGALANPGVILSHALASIISRTGEILVPALKPRAIPPFVREALGDITIFPGPDAPEIDTWWGEPGLSVAEKVYGWNTFEILAFETGTPENPVNAVPPRAFAHCQIRFTVDTDPETFIPAIRAHLDANDLSRVTVREAAGRTTWPATRLDPRDSVVDWAAASILATTGKAPARLPNIGASMPNDVFAEMLGMRTIWVPHSYPGCSQHAPNEHGLGTLFRESLAIMAGLFWDMGETPPPTLGRDA